MGFNRSSDPVMMITEPEETVLKQPEKGSDHYDGNPAEIISDSIRRKRMENKLPENIRSHRKSLGFTQEQLAERLGITLGTISKWERGSSEPDLGYLMDLAELFHVSVDALIGFSMRGADADTEADRIEDLFVRATSEEIAAEYDSALKKFPNHFRLVAGAAETHRQIGTVYKRDGELKQALELYRHAIDLISQNRDPKITEADLRNAVAECYTALKDYKRAVEEYKKNNVCGNNDARIGLMLIEHEKNPEEGIKYTIRAFISQIGVCNNATDGFIRYYSDKGDLARSIRAAEWMIRYLESLKENPDRRCFLDKIVCLYRLLLAVLQDADGQPEKAEENLRAAVRIAEAFDRDPVFTLENILFTGATESHSTLYDSSGPTALDGLKDTLAEVGGLVTASFREKVENALRSAGTDPC